MSHWQFVEPGLWYYIATIEIPEAGFGLRRDDDDYLWHVCLRLDPPSFTEPVVLLTDDEPFASLSFAKLWVEAMYAREVESA
jgi:hypothetical protein